ncbi:ABC transporter ATP-binding protein [bacterium]|nr:ABC transporter ATP-binding protein [bacterium]
MSTSDAALLRVEDLRKSYRLGLRRRQCVLRGLGLRVERGEVYGLLGRNGAGKTTTFRLLTGLARPDGGAIHILGGRPGDRDVHLRLGYCPENPQFPPNLTVRELMRFHAALVASRLVTTRNRVDWLAAQFDLSGVSRRELRQLSRGTQQRVALALALLARPERLILDEPLTALDPLQRQRVIEILLEHKRAGTAMIVSSHVLTELQTLADRLGVLAEGRIGREIDLGAVGALPLAMDIRIPFEKAKEARLDAPDLEGVREGDTAAYRGLSFARAQTLLQRWSALGIPILELAERRELPAAEILASIAEDAAPAAVSEPARARDRDRDKERV